MDEATGTQDAATRTKATLRRQVRALRRELPPGYRSRADTAITATLLPLLEELLDGVTTPTVGLYAALPGEVDVEGAVGPLHAAATAVAFPRVVDATTMRFHEVREAPTGPQGRLTIREPGADNPLASPQVVVLPGLAFDQAGGRLGQGAGYYDRWLAANPGVLTVGVCYVRLLVEEVPMLAHDVRVDAVVTEDAVYR